MKKFLNLVPFILIGGICIGMFFYFNQKITNNSEEIENIRIETEKTKAEILNISEKIESSSEEIGKKFGEIENKLSSLEENDSNFSKRIVIIDSKVKSLTVITDKLTKEIKGQNDALKEVYRKQLNNQVEIDSLKKMQRVNQTQIQTTQNQKESKKEEVKVTDGKAFGKPGWQPQDYSVPKKEKKGILKRIFSKDEKNEDKKK